MSIDLRMIALSIIDKNPNVANNPRNKAMIEAIRNGNQEQGEALARNLCNSYGKSPEQATQEARSFFKI